MITATVVHGQQEIYDHFSVRENLTVAYITDFRVDSVVMDVVLIEAQDDTAWRQLLEETGNLGKHRDIGKMNQKVLISYRSERRPKKDFLKLAASKDIAGSFEASCSVYVQLAEQRIFVFFPTDSEQAIKTIEWMLPQSK